MFDHKIVDRKAVEEQSGCLYLTLVGNVPQIAVVADLRSEKLSTELETNI
jgi:hypothetical protein